VGLTDEISVTVLVADYVGIDAAGKLNLIGAGFLTTGLDPNTGMTPPFSLAVLIEAPPTYVATELAVTLELRDETSDSVVQMAGPTGQREALRISQLARFEKTPPLLNGMVVPDGLPTRLQFNVGFSNGLPLKPGVLYAWRVDIDGQRRKPWAARFTVPAPPPGPVFGGPVGPSGIPNLPNV
jgi:hypothetical protein